MSSSTGQGMRSVVLRRLVNNWFQKITRSDLKLMGVLWSSEFIGPWVRIWAHDSLEKVIRLQDSNSSNFRIYYIVLLVLKIVVTIAVSIVVDVRNHKFIVYLISLFVYAIGPIFGVLAAIVQNVVLNFFTLWLTASLFVTYPTKFCLIFNQRPNASVTETRQVVALFEMANSLSILLLFIFLYFNNYEFTQAVSIVFWIIFIVLIAGLIMLTLLVRRYATKEVIKESNILAVLDGMRQDVVKNQGDSSETVKRKTACAQRFIVFVLLLLPILVITSFDVALTIIDSFASRNIKDDSPNKLHKFIAKLLAIPAICLFFSLVRGIFARLGDILVIAAAHTFNTIVILLIVQYFSAEDIIIDTKHMSRSTGTSVISGYIPNSEQAVVNIFGGTDISFLLKTTTYNTSKPSRSAEFVVDVKHPMSFEMEIRKVWGYKTLHFSMVVEPNKRYWFLLLGAGYEFTELIRIFGVDEPWIFENPKLIVLNGVVRKGVPANHLKFVVRDVESNVASSYSLPFSNTSTSVILKQSNYTFSFDTTTTRAINMLPYTENVAVISYFRGSRIIIFRTLKTRPIEHRPSEHRPSEHSKLLHASYVLSGLTQAAATVGYLHFFWMESPVRLKTTLLACFLVINETVAELTKELTYNFGLNEALVYLALSCCTWLFHICLALLYDLRFRHDLLQPREETVPRESPAPELIVSQSAVSTTEEKTNDLPSADSPTEEKTKPKTNNNKKWWSFPS